MDRTYSEPGRQLPSLGRIRLCSKQTPFGSNSWTKRRTEFTWKAHRIAHRPA